MKIKWSAKPAQKGKTGKRVSENKKGTKIHETREGEREGSVQTQDQENDKNPKKRQQEETQGAQEEDVKRGIPWTKARRDRRGNPKGKEVVEETIAAQPEGQQEGVQGRGNKGGGSNRSGENREGKERGREEEGGEETEGRNQGEEKGDELPGSRLPPDVGASGPVSAEKAANTAVILEKEPRSGISVSVQRLKQIPILKNLNVDIERERKKLSTIPSYQCSTCVIGPECPQYKEGYVCAYEDA